MNITLTVITGPMFSGKTEELIRQIRRSEFAGEKVQIFKPKIDNRWKKQTHVCSHAGWECEAIPVIDPSHILKHLKKKTTLVAIDEIQLFPKLIEKVVCELLNRHISVIAAGLPADFRDESFGSMPFLLTKADHIRHLTAICTYINGNNKPCGREATKTQRLLNGQPARYNDPIILIGAAELYAPRCSEHHQVPGKPDVKF